MRGKKENKLVTEIILTQYRNKPYPKNVEKQIDRYRKETDKKKRKLIYEYIQLERLIAGGYKIFK